jgi:small-conductance mechanosensitive channel
MTILARAAQEAPGAPAGDVSILDAVRPLAVFEVLLTLAVAWAVVRSASEALRFMSDRVPKARFFFKRIEPFVRIAVWFVVAFVVLTRLSPNQDAFLAGLGSIAIALGLGAQDLIKNVIGGVIVLTDRPYQLGDRVRIGDAYGEIDHIGLRSTKLTTPDDTRVTIPNAAVLNDRIFNANSGVPDCQVVTDVFLPATVDPEMAIEVGREAAYASPFVLLDKPVVVLLSDQYQDRPYVRLRIKAYVYDHRFEPRMQSDITVRAKKEFLKRGVLASWAGSEAATSN